VALTVCAHLMPNTETRARDAIDDAQNELSRASSGGRQLITKGDEEPTKNVRNPISEIWAWTEIADLPGSGRLQVESKSSMYVIDFGAATVIRVPGAIGGTAAYDAYNAAVRRGAPVERLVEWAPSMGWEPLS
jgi:hypothetical protein